MNIVRTLTLHYPGFEMVLKISLILTFDRIVTQSWVRGQSGGSWGWQTQLDHSQVCSTCISRVYTCMHVKYTCIHGKYTCYTPWNSLAMLAILKIPYFDPSYTSVTSEIFLSLILKNDPCLKNGIATTDRIFNPTCSIIYMYCLPQQLLLFMFLDTFSEYILGRDLLKFIFSPSSPSWDNVPPYGLFFGRHP